MNRKTILALCLVFAAVLALAGVLYNTLGDSVQLGGLATMPPETQPPAETQAVSPTEITETQPTDPMAYLAPDFTMLDMEGNEVSLASFFGKPIILNFWASWCDPCKSEMPELQKFYEEYGEEIQSGLSPGSGNRKTRQRLAVCKRRR